MGACIGICRIILGHKKSFADERRCLSSAARVLDQVKASILMECILFERLLYPFASVHTNIEPTFDILSTLRILQPAFYLQSSSTSQYFKELEM